MAIRNIEMPESTQDAFVLLSGMVGLFTAVRRMKDVGTPVSFDTETTGLDPRTSRMIALQFKQEGYPAYIVDTRQIPLDALKHLLQPLFDTLPVVGMNLKFDYKMMRYHTGVVLRQCYDIKLAEQVIYGLGTSDAQGRGMGMNMKAIAERYGRQVSKEERNWFIDLDQRPEEWFAPFPEEQCVYMAQDVEIPLAIRALQMPVLEKMKLTDAFDLEMRVMPAIGWMELAGVPVDVDAWRAIIAEVAEDAEISAVKAAEIFGAAILESRAQEYDLAKEQYDAWVLARDHEQERLHSAWEAGDKGIGWGVYKTDGMKLWREANPNPGKPKIVTDPPNIGSHTQLKKAFELMGIARRGEALSSTAAGVISEWVDEFPVLGVLQEHSKLQKIVSSFGESLLQYYAPETGRIYPEFDQYGASTRRMSCRRPNWQQIPSRSEVGKRLRECVRSQPRYRIATADYSSIEPRILAELSGDPVLLDLFARGADIYSETARMVLNLPADMNVKKERPDLRTLFKTIMLGLSYGMGPQSLAKQVGISVSDAKKNIDGFFHLYAGVRRYLNGCKSQVHQSKETRTLVGGARFYEWPHPGKTPEERDEYQSRIAGIERMAMNTPMQGGSADITKLATALFYEKVAQTESTDIRLIAVVHDELVVECLDTCTEAASDLLSAAMDEAAKHFLKKVFVPAPDVAISEFWCKE